MKYQSNDHELSRRRRRNKVAVNCDGPTAYLSHSNQSDSKETAVPIVMQDHSATGVLSASLKLPLQVQFQDEHTNLNLAPELQNIPYIEDSSSSGELLVTAEQLIHSPSGVIKSQSKKRIESVTLPKSISLQKSPSSPPFTATSMAASLIQPSPVPHHTEPKLTPSITNIGGAVMRSKTADFERLLSQNSKSTRKPDATAVTMVTTTTMPTVPTVTTAATVSSTTDNDPMTTGAKVKPTESFKRTGPIYKRQELIASTPKAKKPHW